MHLLFSLWPLNLLVNFISVRGEIILAPTIYIAFQSTVINVGIQSVQIPCLIYFHLNTIILKIIFAYTLIQ